ncbi:unnamed protein product, partial [Oppiella nova]
MVAGGDDPEHVGDRQSMLWLPFAIIGGLQLTGGILILSMYFIHKYQNRNHMISENQSQVSNELVARKLFDKKPVDIPLDIENCQSTTLITTSPNDNTCIISTTIANSTPTTDNPYTPTTTKTPISRPSLWKRISKDSERWVLIGFVSAFLAFQMSSEVIYMQFSATYFQYIPLRLTAQTSATLMSSMALTFTMGRGISIFVAMRFRPQTIIMGHLLISFIGLGVLWAGQTSLVCLWAGAMIMSYGLSPIICSTYCFLAQYLDVKNRIGTVLLFSAESLNMFVPFLMGIFIEKYAHIFTVIMFANLLLSSLIFAGIIFIVNRAERRRGSVGDVFYSHWLGGFLIKYLNRQLVLAVFLVIMAIGTAFIPHSSNLYILYTCAIGLGMGSGIINCVVNVWIIEMWLQKSAPVLQIPGLTYGLGSIVTPLLLKPFLRDKFSGDSDTTTTGPGITVSTPDSVTYAYNEDYEEHRRSLLKTPFLILGIIQMI